MGGNIVMNTILRNDPVYNCAVLEAPWFGLYEPLNPVKIFIVRLLNRLTPDFTTERKTKKSAPGNNETNADEYDSDPLNHRTISMRMLTGVLDGCRFALKNAKRLRVPTFIAVANNDTVVCNRTIKEFAADAADMVTLKEYASSHSIHCDASRESYFRDVTAFLDSHL
jgi:alpha-beta hydrolase superfamily lysophospholipase